MKPNRKRARDLSFYLILLLILVMVIFSLNSRNANDKMIYSELSDLFTQDKVQSFVTENNVITLQVRTGETVETGKEITEERSYELYSFSVFYEDFRDLILAQGYEKIAEYRDVVEIYEKNFS